MLLSEITGKHGLTLNATR